MYFRCIIIRFKLLFFRIEYIFENQTEVQKYGQVEAIMKSLIGIRTFRPKKMCTRTGYWRPIRPDVPARDIF